MTTSTYFPLTAFLLINLSSAISLKQGKDYWTNVANDELERSLKVKWNDNVAENVIIFVADGMGVNTVTAGRIFRAGEESHLTFERFPHVGMMKTYGTNKQVPDSACTATALFCGVKNNYETLGVTDDVAYGDCEASLDEKNRLESIMAWAQKAEKATGIVTNTRVTHATPGATYAKSAARHWECDSRVPANSGCKDIARQLVEDLPGKDFKVVLGGGLQCMTSGVNITINDPIDNTTGLRTDGLNLLEGWAQDKKDRGATVLVAQNTSQLKLLDAENTDYLIGVFSNSHMPYEYLRDKTDSGMPSLTQMTTAALSILMKNKNGFILMVEGGMIDQAHHLGAARIALEEVVEFNNAVNTTLKILEDAHILDDTLVIVTSDHGHTLSINGYPDKGSNILGVATRSKVDGIPWTTLTYGVATKNNYQYTVENGEVKRQDPRNMVTTSHEFRQLSAAQHDQSAHGGGDVIAYAKGPMAHLIHSIHEQNYIAYVMAYAAKIGPFAGLTTSDISITKPNYIICILIPLLLTVIFISKR